MSGSENDDDVIETLARSHQDFLAFVTRRVGGDRELAKEIVQEAFRRGIEKVEQLNDDERGRRGRGSESSNDSTVSAPANEGGRGGRGSESSNDSTVSAPANERVRAWFYRSLRNAVIDHGRRKQTAEKALTAFAAELDPAVPAEPEVENAVCQCVKRLASTLKPEYRAAIDQVEVEGISVAKLAEREGITPNNAAVRVFRAREALRKRVVDSCGACAEHGCLNCTCSH